LWRLLHLRAVRPNKDPEAKLAWLNEESWCFESIDLSGDARKQKVLIIL